jgi:phospholipase/carboxylesterase
MSFLLKILRTICMLVTFTALLLACNQSEPEVTRIQARPTTPVMTLEPGEHNLDLGGFRLVNRSVIWRDGLLYIPESIDLGAPSPLLVWLHGGGGNADSYRYLFSIAEEYSVVILALDARHNTWDGIDSPFGPDVLFIDEALRHTFERVKIDPQKIALGGLSDGAAYALAIGRANGDLFTHLVAVAAGQLAPPSPPVGKPKIFVLHGTKDTVYFSFRSKLVIVPQLKNSGYEVKYLEFDGPHWLPASTAHEVFKWIAKKN